MLQTGSAWLADQMIEHCSGLITYEQAGQQVTLSAVFGRTMLKLADEVTGFRIVWTDRDFIVRAADLVLNGVAVLPARGDRIAEVSNGVAWTFDVLAPGDEPHWRWSDPERTMLRIHGKLVRRL